MKHGLIAVCAAVGLILGLLPGSGLAADTELHLVIKDHRFVPAELALPAGEKVRLIVENQDATPEEFESYDLNREKIVPANDRIVVFVGPLKSGRYQFFGDFHPTTARGWLVAK